jgi:uncharacterized protein (DUF1697 family)
MVESAMPRFIAFLRAINVGGRNVTMEKLRGLFDELGFAKVETFIASGNVIFEAKGRDDAAVARKIEKHLQEALGYEVSTFVRTAEEIAAIAAARPFDEKTMKAATAFNVIFLAEPMPKDLAKEMAKFRTEIDDFRVDGREVYWLCRKKQSESTFSNNVFEKGLRIRATIRGMTTVQKLSAKYPPAKV